MAFVINARDRRVMTRVLSKITAKKHISLAAMADDLLEELKREDHVLISSGLLGELEIKANTHGLAD